MEELLRCKYENPEARIMGGNTEVGIEMHIQGRAYAALIDATHIPELRVLEETPAGSLRVQYSFFFSVKHFNFEDVLLHAHAMHGS